jgi:hypothetical protein
MAFITPVVGDYIQITGPRHRWRPGHLGGWQPRAWSSYPDDPESELVRERDLHVDFSATFQVLEIRTSRRFITARIAIGEANVWTNVAKDDVAWVFVVPEPPGLRAWVPMVPELPGQGQ